MSKKLTSRAEDYSKWYNELVVKADLAENSAVRGCMVIKPYGYAIWEKMQAELDRMLMIEPTGAHAVQYPKIQVAVGQTNTIKLQIRSWIRHGLSQNVIANGLRYT